MRYRVIIFKDYDGAQKLRAIPARRTVVRLRGKKDEKEKEAANC